MSENKFHSVSDDSPDLMSVRSRLNISRLNPAIDNFAQRRLLSLLKIGSKKAGFIKKMHTRKTNEHYK